jgi:hypothetical protein
MKTTRGISSTQGYLIRRVAQLKQLNLSYPSYRLGLVRDADVFILLILTSTMILVAVGGESRPDVEPSVLSWGRVMHRIFWSQFGRVIAEELHG